MCPGLPARKQKTQHKKQSQTTQTRARKKKKQQTPHKKTKEAQHMKSVPRRASMHPGAPRASKPMKNNRKTRKRNIPNSSATRRHVGATLVGKVPPPPALPAGLAPEAPGRKALITTPQESGVYRRRGRQITERPCRKERRGSLQHGRAYFR